MLRVLVEVAGAEQVATASLDVVGLHPPRRAPRLRSHEHKSTKREKAYLYQFLHFRLPCGRGIQTGGIITPIRLAGALLIQLIKSTELLGARSHTPPRSRSRLGADRL